MSAPATPEVRLAPGPVLEPVPTPPAVDFTDDERDRARRGAWRRYEVARLDHNCWARIVARDAARGVLPIAASAYELLVARAGEYEANADWLQTMPAVA